MRHDLPHCLIREMQASAGLSTARESYDSLFYDSSIKECDGSGIELVIGTKDLWGRDVERCWQFFFTTLIPNDAPTSWSNT